MTLDTFFQAPKPKETERCSNPKCGKILGVKEPKYTLTIKGKATAFCRECARKHLPEPRPRLTIKEYSEEEAEDESKDKGSLMKKGACGGLPTHITVCRITSCGRTKRECDFSILPESDKYTKFEKYVKRQKRRNLCKIVSNWKCHASDASSWKTLRLDPAILKTAKISQIIFCKKKQKNYVALLADPKPS